MEPGILRRITVLRISIGHRFLEIQRDCPGLSGATRGFEKDVATAARRICLHLP